MNSLFFVVVVIMAVAFFVAQKFKKPAKDEGLAFEKREPLFSPAERSFLGVLEQALDSRYRVFGKVRLGDIVKPAKDYPEVSGKLQAIRSTRSIWILLFVR